MLFKSISTFAIFALGAVSVFAAPSANPAAEAGLTKRDNPASVPQIFADATTNLTPLTAQLQGLTPDQLTTDHISPITGAIGIILNEVITDLGFLVGEEASIVLLTVDKTALVTLHDLAIIVSELVHLVFAALSAVLALLSAHPLVAVVAIKALLFTVGQLVGTIVVTVIQVAGVLLPGLSLAITVLLLDLTGIITQLGLTILAGLLGIILL